MHWNNHAVTEFCVVAMQWSYASKRSYYLFCEDFFWKICSASEILNWDNFFLCLAYPPLGVSPAPLFGRCKKMNPLPPPSLFNFCPLKIWYCSGSSITVVSTFLIENYVSTKCKSYYERTLIIEKDRENKDGDSFERLTKNIDRIEKDWYLKYRDRVRLSLQEVVAEGLGHFFIHVHFSLHSLINISTVSSLSSAIFAASLVLLSLCFFQQSTSLCPLIPQ